MISLRNFIVLFFTAFFIHAAAQDTTEVPAGVIMVKKPVTTPFVKAEYSLFLSKVRWTDEIVYYHGIPETNRIPVYDSGYYLSPLERALPAKSINLGRYFALNLTYDYAVADTPRVDTLVLGLLLNEKGKIQYVDPDTEDAVHMNADLKAELSAIAMSLEDQDWGEPGGYYEPSHALRPKQFVPECYYCELTIIVSSMPLTPDQKSTRAVFPPRDLPLNTVPVDIDLFIPAK
ncbi:MAG TPA: hypothetical protein VL651_07695 [Bacteroidia bacterium]|jgi:hypothetical protein|nr:hypothetical protein [Bacteroidia bacterium]